MLFSKSFGYAVRSVLYLALLDDEKRFIQAEEVALNLGVPRHFVGKVLKKLVKSGMLSSAKGPCGGFRINDRTPGVTLLQLLYLTDSLLRFKTCALRLHECNAVNPCPIHQEMQEIRGRLKASFTETTIGHLLKKDKKNFIKSISSEELF